MIHANKRFLFCIFVICSIPFMLLGCGGKKNENTAQKEPQVTLNSGSVLKSEEGSYKVYDYNNNQYSKISNDSVIIGYSRKSNIYIENKNNTNYIVNGENKQKISDDYYEGMKLSPDGKYLAYFMEDNGLKLKVLNTSDAKEINRKSDVVISGTLYDWYDDHTLVYYGVDSKKTNGIFIYNLNNNSEELLHEVKDGFISYIEALNDVILTVQIDMNNEKELIFIDKKSKDTNLVSQDVEEIYGAVQNGKEIYFAGRTKDNAYSIYRIYDNNIKRLVFDFPAAVKYKKGVCIDKQNNILFIGSDSEESNEEKVYMIGQDSSVSVVSDPAIDYAFIEFVN